MVLKAAPTHRSNSMLFEFDFTCDGAQAEAELRSSAVFQKQVTSQRQDV